MLAFAERLFGTAAVVKVLEHFSSHDGIRVLDSIVVVAPEGERKMQTVTAVVYLLVMWLQPTGPYQVIPTPAPISSEAECLRLAASIRRTGYVKCLPYEALIAVQNPPSCGGNALCGPPP